MNVTFPIIMSGSGSQQFTAPRGVKFISIVNNSDNTLELYQDLRTALDSNIRDVLIKVSPFSAITLPLTETRLEFTVIFINGGGQGVKAAQLLFSDINLQINTTFSNPSGNANITITTDAVGLVKGTQLPGTLSPSGNLKVEVLNEVPVSVAGNVEITNDTGNPIPVSGAVSVNPLPAGSNNIGRVKAEQGSSSRLNITAATLVKAGAGRVIRISVIVPGTAAGAVHDAATTGGAAAANQIAEITNTVGVIYLDWPCVNGIVIAPGTGQTLAVSYE